jgi:hypothetical protein
MEFLPYYSKSRFNPKIVNEVAQNCLSQLEKLGRENELSDEQCNRNRHSFVVDDCLVNVHYFPEAFYGPDFHVYGPDFHVSVFGNEKAVQPLSQRLGVYGLRSAFPSFFDGYAYVYDINQRGKACGNYLWLALRIGFSRAIALDKIVLTGGD